MPIGKRSIFRESAIKQYLQGRDKDVLPRFIAPPFFLFLWIVSLLFLSGAIVIWNIQVPVMVQGVGTIVQEGQTHTAMAIIFLTSEQLQKVHAGQPVNLQMNGTSASLDNQAVTSVETKLLSPLEARQRFHLDGSLSLLVTQPAGIALVLLTPQPSSQLYTGSIFHATVYIGTRRMLSLLTVSNISQGGK